MLSLLILFLASNANGNNGEEEANRQRELHPHTHTSCSYTKIRTAMFDCLDEALTGERLPVDLTSEYEKSVYGPGDVTPKEKYTDDVHTKVCDGGAASVVLWKRRNTLAASGSTKIRGVEGGE